MNFFIAFTVSLMGCCVTIPLYFRYGYYSNHNVLFFIVSLIIACMPILAVPDNIALFGRYYLSVQRLCYFVFITAVILFGLTFVRDIIWTFLALLFKDIPSPLNLTYLHFVNGITLFLAFICSVGALIEGNKIPEIKEQVIYTNKVTKAKKIILLADLHLSRVVKADKVKGIVERVNKQNADAILLVGDIIDDEIRYTKPLLEILKNLKAKNGIYYVSGNHEFYIGYDESIKLIQENNFTPLENNGVEIDSFYIGGVPDIPSSKKFGKTVDLDKTFEKVPQNAYRILMAHTPVKLPREPEIDLIVSGHTHGGQIFPFHLFSWVYNNGYLSGLYRIDKHKYIYVSKGSGQWGPQMRFGAPSEITVLTFLPFSQEVK